MGDIDEALKRKCALKLMGGQASVQDRISRDGAIVNLEPPMCWTDVHCSHDLTRTEKSPLDSETNTCVIYPYSRLSS